MNKKINLLLMFLIMLTFTLSGCSMFRHLSYLSDDECIIDASASGLDVLAVTDEGNVYYMGSDVMDSFTNGMPLELSKEINASNLFMGKKFIRMYDKGDAVKAYITTYGGVILTKQNEVYLFLNGENSEAYPTPTMFCSGYTDIELYHDTLYLLSEQGEFGYIPSTDPDGFHLLADNICKFRLAVDDRFHVIAFLLTGDNSLYVYDTAEQFNISAEHFRNIRDFDYCNRYSDSSVLSLLDMNDDAYYYIVSWNELSYEKIQAHKGEKTGENIMKVVAYGTGVAMIDEDGGLCLYGGDLNRHYRRTYTGQLVMHNIKIVAGSADSLFVVKNDGNYFYFGNNGDNTYTPITSQD